MIRHVLCMPKIEITKGSLLSSSCSGWEYRLDGKSKRWFSTIKVDIDCVGSHSTRLMWQPDFVVCRPCTNGCSQRHKRSQLTLSHDLVAWKSRSKQTPVWTAKWRWTFYDSVHVVSFFCNICIHTYYKTILTQSRLPGSQCGFCVDFVESKLWDMQRLLNAHLWRATRSDCCFPFYYMIRVKHAQYLLNRLVSDVKLTDASSYISSLHVLCRISNSDVYQAVWCTPWFDFFVRPPLMRAFL